MSQSNPFDQFDGHAPASPGVLTGPPPVPKEPPAPKTTYRTLSKEEAAAKGLDPATTYQVSSEGKIDPLPGKSGAASSLDPKTLEGQRNLARSTLSGAGVDFNTGADPVADLIKNSTSGKVEHFGADTYANITGLFGKGQATRGMENIGRLATIGNDMVLQASGGSLGAQISNSDRDFLAARFGDIANPDIPENVRLAAWDQVKQRLASIGGIDMGKDNAATAEYHRRIGRGDNADSINAWLGTVGLQTDPASVQKAVDFHHTYPDVPVETYPFTVKHNSPDAAPTQSGHPPDIDALIRKYGGK